MVIGVDTDWFDSAPEYKDVVLTSVLKNMDVAVFNAIKAAHGRHLQGRHVTSAPSPTAAWVSPRSMISTARSRPNCKANSKQLKADIIGGAVKVSQ